MRKGWTLDQPFSMTGTNKLIVNNPLYGVLHVNLVTFGTPIAYIKSTFAIIKQINLNGNNQTYHTGI